MATKTPAIWGTLQPFLEPGAIVGRVSANEGWLRAFLRADPLEEYHFFVPLPEDRERISGEFANVFGELPAYAKIRLRTWMDLPAALAANRYHAFHLADPVSCFVPLQRLRNAHARNAFPVTCLTHSLSYADYPARFAEHVWPGVLPGDAVFCTSRAAVSAACRFYEAASSSGFSSAAASRAPLLPRVPLGVAPEAFHKPGGPEAGTARKRVRERMGLAPGRPMVLVFARLSHTGKLDFLPLFRALLRVRGQGLECALVAAGKVAPGDALPGLLQQMAAEQGLDFRLVSDPDDAARADLYAAADVFLSPVDNIQETFGLTLLEAAVAGLPVIASDFDGYRDLVVHGETGLLVPTYQPSSMPYLDSLAWLLPADLAHLCLAQQTAVDVPLLAEALAALLGDSERRARMGEAGRRRALANFTYDNMIARCLELWEKERGPENIPAHLRTLRHPAEPEYGRTFAVWPSCRPEEETGEVLLTRTAHGDALFAQKHIPPVYSGLETLISSERLRILLLLARRPCSVARLTADLASRAACPEDVARFCVFWALKNDYLRLEPPPAGALFQ